MSRRSCLCWLPLWQAMALAVYLGSKNAVRINQGRFKTGDRSIFYIDCSLEAVPLGGQLFSCLQPPQPVAVPSCASFKKAVNIIYKKRAAKHTVTDRQLISSIEAIVHSMIRIRSLAAYPAA